MTAVSENGQVYWTFDELDFVGACEDNAVVCHQLCERIEFCIENDIVSSSELRELEKELNKLIKVGLYLERLKRGQNYA